MLLKGASSAGGSTSTSNNLLPFMLATQGGSSSSMLPMMMMMGAGSSSGTSSSSNMLTNLAMINAFREGAGDAENTSSLGQLGQSLGFTRAVVSKTGASLDPPFSIAISSTNPYLVANSTAFNVTSFSISGRA